MHETDYILKWAGYMNDRHCAIGLCTGRRPEQLPGCFLRGGRFQGRCYNFYCAFLKVKSIISRCLETLLCMLPGYAAFWEFTLRGMNINNPVPAF